MATAGAATELFQKVPARFLVDPLVYDGKTVQVRARAHTSTLGSRSSQKTFTVARPVPSLTPAADNRHVTASLPQAVTFVFVAKSAGLADAYGPGGTFWAGRTDGDLAPGLVDWDGTHRLSYDAYRQFIS